MKDVLRTVPLSPFAPIRSVIAKKMQENEEKNIKIVAGSKKSRTFATAIEKQRLQRKKGSLDEWLSQRSAKPCTAVRIRQEPPKARKD